MKRSIFIMSKWVRSVSDIDEFQNKLQSGVRTAKRIFPNVGLGVHVCGAVNDPEDAEWNSIYTVEVIPVVTDYNGIDLEFHVSGPTNEMLYQFSEYMKEVNREMVLW